MPTYKIIIDEKNASAKLFLEYMKSLPFISFVSNNTEKINALDGALKDIEERKASTPMSVEEFKERFGMM